MENNTPTTQTLAQKIFAQRTFLDGLAMLILGTNKEVTAYKSHSPELDAARKAVLFAKAWYGALLNEMGNPSPYPADGTRKDVSHIEPTADVNNNMRFVRAGEKMGIFNPDGQPTPEGFTEVTDGFTSHIEKADTLRQVIGESADAAKYLDSDEKLDTREKNICRTNVWNYLKEARFHLGFYLQTVKEENAGK